MVNATYAMRLPLLGFIINVTGRRLGEPTKRVSQPGHYYDR